MAASPRSTVSSDLYSPSEPIQVNVHPRGEVLQEAAYQNSLGGALTETDESAFSDTMQGLDSTGEDASRPSSVAAGITLGPTTPKTNHKRKRDQCVENELAADESPIPDHGAGEEPLVLVDYRYTSPNENPSGWQHARPPDDFPRTKRTRVDGQFWTCTKEKKPSCKVSTLPAALWQYIFCFVPPVFLGHLLLVNRAFKSYLILEQDVEKPKYLPHSIIQPVTPEAIWIASRRRFAPGLPQPIHGLKELDMWRLLVGRKCQRCGHAGDGFPAATENAWESGPGPSGVRVVWPFAMRCCGSCIQDVSKKELDLYISAECPSFLLQAIPFAFVSKDNHYIGHNLLRNQATPPSLQLTKHFYIPTIDRLKHNFEDVKALGSASAEEWIKGLASQGQESLEDIIRWEQWESKGGLRKVNSRPNPKQVPLGAVPIGKKSVFFKDDTNLDRSTPQSMRFSNKGYQANPTPHRATDFAQISLDADTVPVQPAWSVASQLLLGTYQGPLTTPHQPRPERNIKDVNGAKAARRAEIERRCAALDPPLLSNTLSHMESFQAAMQITQPMTEQAWQVLKPRLLAQLPYAERKEKERVLQNALLEEEYQQRRHQEAQLKETKESFDREWENFQNPVRNRLGALADEAIESRWAGGKRITKDTSPKFAADILLNVRQRFYAEIAKEDEVAVAAGETELTDHSKVPPAKKLILENMKWLFDTKIKPLTDHFQRELFLCNGCDGNFKFYGFEGVIQHYAAKHTTALSMGNIVVHWRAEWPEHPPFNPNPTIAKSAYYQVPTPVNHIQGLNARDSQGLTSFGGFNQRGETAPLAFPPRHESTQRSAEADVTSYTGHPQEGHYTTSGLACPPQTTYGAGIGYSGTQDQCATSGASYQLYTAAQQPQFPQVYGSSYSSQQPYPAFAQAQPATNPPGYFPGLSSISHGAGRPVPHQTNFQNHVLAPHVPHILGPVPDLYKRQMEDMAKHAKDVFTGIGGIKDLPGSVRIFVVIQLTVSRFKGTFPNEPSLSMFIDGLDHSPTMRPVRSVNGLGCKTCMSSGTGAKLFTLPHLVNHFRTVHVESPQMLGHPQMPELDWKFDMIDLPDASIISKLVHAAGMTESKLALIASVFHGLFPSPLPHLRIETNTGPLPTFKKDVDLNSGASRVSTTAVNDAPLSFEDRSKDKYPGQSYSGLRDLYLGTSSDHIEPPREDEYDPHRPALLGNVIKQGSSSAHFHKPGRLSTPQNGQSSSFQLQHEPSQHDVPRRAENEPSSGHADTTPTKGSDKYHSVNYETAEIVTQLPSQDNSLIPRFKRRLDSRVESQSVPLRQINYNDLDTSIAYNSEYRQHLSNGIASENPRSARREGRSLSPQEVADAAELFLSNLAPDSDADYSRPYLLEVDRHSKAWSQQAEPQPKRRQKYFGQGGADDRFLANSLNRHESETPTHRIRTGPSGIRIGGEMDAPHRSGSTTQYFEEYRPPPQVQIPLKSLRADEGLSARHEPQQSVVQERQETSGSVLKRPRSGSHTYLGTRMSQHRPRSGSSNEVSADTALYHPRSPVEEDRGEPGYRAHSPSSIRCDRPQRLVSYEYPPQAHYEYIEDRGFREPQYEQQVEYVRVPLEYEKPSVREGPVRYYVSRPIEQVEPEYLRYEQAYATKPAFERNGQVYHAAQRAYEDQPNRTAPAFAQGYNY